MIHKHHIIPKHMGGTDEESNIAHLTVAEHADAHNLLWCLHKNPYDKIAELTLLGQMTMSEAKQASRDEGMRRGRIIARERNTGKAKSEEHKKKLSEAKLGKPVHSEEHKQALSIRMSANNPSMREEVKEQRREFLKNNNPVHTAESLAKMKAGVKASRAIKHECEHCSKLVDSANLKRWHNDNCKEAPHGPHIH